MKSFIKFNLGLMRSPLQVRLWLVLLRHRISLHLF